MLWQDCVLFSGNILFGLLLIPMLIDARNGIKVNVYTAGLTCAVLLIFNFTYLTLNLFYSAIPFTALIWGGIFYFSVRGTGKNGTSP